LINASPAPATLILFFPRDFFLILGVFITPVAGLLYWGGNLSPILQGRFCKPYPADFSVALY